jgi:hypothetical protein
MMAAAILAPVTLMKSRRDNLLLMLLSFRARSFMASHTIGQFGQHDWIVLKARAVTAQTPTHIHFLRLGEGHLADLRMAIFAVEAGCNVRAVAVVDKVRQ